TGVAGAAPGPIFVSGAAAPGVAVPGTLARFGRGVPRSRGRGHVAGGVEEPGQDDAAQHQDHHRHNDDGNLQRRLPAATARSLRRRTVRAIRTARTTGTSGASRAPRASRAAGARAVRAGTIGATRSCGPTGAIRSRLRAPALRSRVPVTLRALLPGRPVTARTVRA